MADSAQIQRVSIKHEAILDHLMAYPTMKLGDVAAQFGVSQPWLSTVIHSDAFQALLRDKQGIAFHHTVLPLREKMMAVAHQAFERIVDMLPMETEVKNLSSVAEGVLDRLGYGTKASVIVNNTHNTTHTTQVNVLRSELEEAQKLLSKSQNPQIGSIPSTAIGVSFDGQPSPIALPRTSNEVLREDAPRVGPALPATRFYSPESQAFTEGEIGGEV